MIRLNPQDSEDDSDEGMGMRQAFQVPPIPANFDPTIPPSSGEEYLQHVLHESKSYASIFTAKRVDAATLNAKCDPKMVNLKPKLSASPLAPTEDWENKQIETFTKLRNSVLKQRLKPNSCDNAHIFVPDVDASSLTWVNFINEHQPLLSVVFALRQEQLERVLKVLLQLPLMEAHGAWVYAICACLDHPLSKEACGDLRDIARNCSEARKTKENIGRKELAMMNLLITLVVKYFKQSDLCDDLY